MKFNFLALLFLLAINIYNAQSQINLYGNLKFGPHDVGVKQLTYTDTSKENSRTIQITHWYPAKDNLEQLKFSEYLDYKKELNETELVRDISIGIGGKENLFSIDSLESVLNANMRAGKDAEEKDGKFPLLIWSIRYGTVEYQNIISEYLASHGFVVAFAEDTPNSLYPWQLQSTDKTDVLYQQVSDINTSIEFLTTYDYIDSTKIGLLSWSYAGESAILTQMSNPDIDLVVGLSALSFSSGVYLGGELAEKIDVEKLSVPYLIMTQRFRANGAVMTPPNVFDSMHSNSRYVAFHELAHGSFNALEGMIPGVLKTNKVHSWSRGGEIARIGYEAICQITLLFLNAVLKETNSDSFDSGVLLIKENLPLELTLASPVK